jgi:hypothetical protein
VCEAKEQGAAAVIHCGDLIGAHTLRPAMSAGLPVHLIQVTTSRMLPPCTISRARAAA